MFLFYLSVVVSCNHSYRKIHNGYDIVVLIKSLRSYTRSYLKVSSVLKYNDNKYAIKYSINIFRWSNEEDLLPQNDQNESPMLMP